jgi:hypothetical protein
MNRIGSSGDDVLVETQGEYLRQGSGHHREYPRHLFVDEPRVEIDQVTWRLILKKGGCHFNGGFQACDSGRIRHRRSHGGIETSVLALAQRVGVSLDVEDVVLDLEGEADLRAEFRECRTLRSIDEARRAASSIRSARDNGSTVPGLVESFLHERFSQSTQFPQPRNEQTEPFVKAHRVVSKPPTRRIVRRPGSADLAGRGLCDRHQGGTEFQGQGFRVRPIVEVLHAVVDAGEFACPIASGGSADGVLGSSDQQIPFAGHTAVERRDRSTRDIGRCHPRHRES